MGLVISLTSVATDCRRAKGDLETTGWQGLRWLTCNQAQGFQGAGSLDRKVLDRGGLWEERGG